MYIYVYIYTQATITVNISMSSGKCGHDPAKHILKSPPRVPGSDPLALGNPCFHTLSCWFHLVKSRRQHSFKKKVQVKTVPKSLIGGKKSFGGIPNSCNILFLQIFLKLAAKPSAGNTSAGFPWIKWPQILLTLLRNPVDPDLALHQSLPDLLRKLLWNVLRNPVEPNLALQACAVGNNMKIR